MKSANVVLTDSLVPKLCDFGLSGLLPHVSNLSDVDRAQGTPAYMPPELVLGTSAGSSPQAIDMFGVGVVLHDLAHIGVVPPQRPPSAGGASVSGSSASQRRTQDSTTVTGGELKVLVERHAAGFKVDVGPQCPAALAAIIQRCMALQPTDRPPSGEALTAMLQVAAEAADAAARGQPWT